MLQASSSSLKQALRRAISPAAYRALPVHWRGFASGPRPLVSRDPDASNRIQGPPARTAFLPAAHRHRRGVRRRRVCAAADAFHLPADSAVRLLPHQGRGQPYLDRADHAQPRTHSGPQRHRAGAQLFGLHAGNFPGRSHRPGENHRRACEHRRDPPERSHPLQAPVDRIQGSRQRADPHAPDRRGGGQVRRQPLPLSRRRHPRATVPPVPA